MIRPRKTRVALLALAMILLAGSVVWAQYGRRGRGPRRPPAPSLPQDWKNREGFERDVFTFVRVKYDSPNSYRGWNDKWTTDFPDAEMNFSYRLQQMTSLKVEPIGQEGRVLELTDPDLANYPFIYMVEPGGLGFSNEEVDSLRRYLVNGGFLLVDDFWGEEEWENFYYEIKRVFPDREPMELPLEHPIFSMVFPLKEKPQLPSIHTAMRFRGTPITWEREDAEEVHYKAIFDDKGRIMVMICHNTDLGDGWEREGEDPYYFTEFSEKKGYPMGINILFYALTH